MQPTDLLTTLFQHHLWANLSLLERCAALTDEQLETTVPGAYGSIRATLEHIVTAERSYTSRITTGQMYREPADAAPLTLAEMADALRTTGQRLIAAAPGVQPDELAEVDWDGTPRDVPKVIILTQVINHATDHRAQIMAILTDLGVESPNLQPWAYFDELG